MSIQFPSPTSAAQLAERAATMQADADALTELAQHLAEYEERTGQPIFVIGARGYSDPIIRAALGQGGPHFGNGATLTELDERCSAEAPRTGAMVSSYPKATAPLQAAEAECGSAETLAAPDAKAVIEKIVCPAPKPVASAATRSPRPDNSRAWGKLNLTERRVVKHLERVAGLPWDRALRLVEMLASGWKLVEAAEALKLTADKCLDEWRAMIDHDDVSGRVKARGKGPTIDGQKRLLTALRYLAEANNG